MSGKLLLAAVIPVAMFCAGHAQDNPEKRDSVAQAEMMATAMELAQPGEEHKLLEKLAGKWNLETKMWMSPGADPMFLTGRSSAEMILGGRFLYGEFSSDTEQMKGEGFFVIGFDRRHEKFTYVGFDTWGTYSVAASGTYDERTKSITLYGEDDDPVMGNTQKYNFVISFNADGSWRFDVVYLDKIHTQGADQFKMAEINYLPAGQSN